MQEDARTILHGHCLCGKVRLQVQPEALHADACHCGMCRRWGGGPFLSLGCGTQLRFERGKDAVALFDSSEWGQRAFCTHCGSHLFYRLRAQGTYYVSAGLFGEVEGLRLESEIFIDRKPAWYAFANPTRKMTEAEVIAAFASG